MALSCCRRLLLPTALVLLEALSGAAQDAHLVSRVDPTLLSDTAGGGSGAASADGRYVTFLSVAQNLVAGQVDAAGRMDVFLRDRLSGSTTLVSHPVGLPSTGAGGFAHRMSADGAYVLFGSEATTLVSGQIDANSGGDVFLWERLTDTVRLVSHRAGQPTVAGGGVSYLGALSSDGRYVAFVSYAPDLVQGQSDTNAELDVFLWDRVTGTTTLVTHLPGAAASAASAAADHTVFISPSGDYVAFQSKATDLVAGQSDTPDTADVFLFHRPSGLVQLVSHAFGSPTAARGGFLGALGGLGAAEGRTAFTSDATDLVAGQNDTNGENDVFLYERDTGIMLLASHRPGQPATTANGDSSSYLAGLSADGSRLAFWGSATDLVPGITDANDRTDVFLYDRSLGLVSLVSRAAGTNSTGNDGSAYPVVSPDGRYVAFNSQANNLVAGQIDTNGEYDVFLHDSQSGLNTLVSHRASSAVSAARGDVRPPGFSGNGTFVLFDSFGRDLVAGVRDGLLSGGDVFLYEVAGGSVSTVSLRHPSLPSLAAGGNVHLPFDSSVSDDGRYAAFASIADDLVPGQVDAGGPDVFVYDRQTGVMRLASHRAGLPATAATGIFAALSGDGRFVAFLSGATDIVPGQSGPANAGIFLFELATGATSLVSHATGSPAEMANDHSRDMAISADGRFVAFLSDATNLVPGQVDVPETSDVFLYDRLSGSVSLVSHQPGSLTATGLCPDAPQVSRDGSLVAYASEASNLVPFQNDVNGARDAFVYERATGLNRLVSRSSLDAARTGNGRAEWPTLSGDGRFVGFTSAATDHVPGQQDAVGGSNDVFVYDRASGTTLLASRAAGTALRTANSSSFGAVLDGSGAALAFTSQATDLVAGASLVGQFNVFVFEPATGRTTLVSHRPGQPLQGGNHISYSGRVSLDGRRVAYESFASDLVHLQQDAPQTQDVFLYDRASAGTTLLSHARGQASRAGERESERQDLSADGTTVVFDSRASDLHPADYDYRPGVLGYEGTDVFLLRVNGAPTALSQSVSLREDTTRAIVLAGSDVDGDLLTYALTSPAQHGSVSGTPPNVTYTPLPEYHGPDSFTFTASDGRDTSVPGTISITVTPDTALAVADVAVVEGDAGTTTLTFTVTATPASSGPVTISYNTVDGTAAAGSDYVAASGILSFAAGQTSRPLAVTVNGDTALEDNETFLLHLLSPAGADVEDSQAVGGITDDDDAACTRPPIAAITAPDSVCLNRPASAGVPDAGAGAAYNWTITNGTITSGTGTPQITLGAAAPGTVGLSVTVTNASGCTANDDAALSGTPPCYGFFPLAPCRLADTRTGVGPAGGPALAANSVRAFAVAGICGVPPDAVAVAVNATTTGQTEAGNLRLYPAGSPAPLASFLNFAASRVRAGGAVVPLGVDGGVAVQCDMAPGSAGETHFILDVSGYFR